MADRTATVEITAHSRGLAAKLREARGKFSSFMGEQRKAFGKIAGGAMSSFAGNMASNVASRGLDFMVEGGKRQAEYNEQLTRFGMATKKTPEQLAALSASIRDVSDEVAIGRNELLAGAHAYVGFTGDAEGAALGVRAMGRAAQASNSSMEDIAATGAAMKQNLKIDPKDFEAGFGMLIELGNAGSVELKNVAEEMSSLAPMTTMFKGGFGLEGLADTSANLQIIMKGYGTAAEAATGYRALMTSLLKPNETLRKSGLQLYDKDPKTGVKTMRSFRAIMTDIEKSKLVRDPDALSKALGSTEALRSFQQIRENIGLYDEFLAKSKETGVVQRDLQKFMASDAGKVKKTWNEAKNTLADAFTPERIQAFTNALVLAGQAMAKLVGWMSDAAGIVEKVGQGAAILFGGSKPLTMDEQAGEARHKHRNERLAFLRSRGHAFDAQGRMDKEDILEDQLANRGGAFWEGQARQSGMSAMEYGLTQREGIKKSGASNETMLLIQSAKAMGQAMAFEITKHLPPVEVKVGEDTVVKADRQAPNHRRRPGG